ncbi:MAG: hypothetical protein ACUVSQ_01020 [Pseudanabaenaceae cyanobacterium]
MTFEEAIAQAGEILAQGEAVWRAELPGFWQTELGPRAFWVSWLTGDHPQAEDPPPVLVDLVAAGPVVLSELLVKNLAMSTAMALTHERQNHGEGVAGSRQVQRRSAVFVRALLGPALRARLAQLRAAALGETNADEDFLTKWGYDDEQRAAIAQVLAPLLT